MVNAEKIFTDLVVGWTGNTKDSIIWNNKKTHDNHGCGGGTADDDNHDDDDNDGDILIHVVWWSK